MNTHNRLKRNTVYSFVAPSQALAKNESKKHIFQTQGKCSQCNESMYQTNESDILIETYLLFINRPKIRNIHTFIPLYHTVTMKLSKLLYSLRVLSR